jgi:hypothetical protein
MERDRMKNLAVFTVFMAVSGFLFAQNAAELDGILNAQEITCSQVARFILTAANALPGGGDAFTAAMRNNWLPAGAAADKPISLGELSLLIMKSFGLKGGVLYTFFPNPRYACRELIYLRIVQGRTDPDERLDGQAFLRILSRVLTYEAKRGGIST